jgi:transcriptional regulator with XRE-family HTH domain
MENAQMAKILAEIGSRLREERIRLFKTQEAMADASGAARNSIKNYESGDTPINVALLLVLQDLGFDIGYVVTGRRSEGELGMGDSEVVRLMSLLSHREREAVMQLLYTLTGETVLVRHIGPVGNIATLHEQRPGFRRKDGDE